MNKAILNSDLRDVVKKGHRKSKYLFAFPGLLSPVAGGKLGELTNLDSRNPVLYVEFPQGRLKMFGTIVYPKNKYLTLHFPRGGGNIVCEDCFESLIVFSQAWWIGTKEQNPEEVHLQLPKSLEQEKNAEIDFTAGAGQTKGSNKIKHPLEKSEVIPPAVSMSKPEISEAESAGKGGDAQGVIQSVRHSARTAGRTLKYAVSSSDSKDSNSDESQHILSPRGKQQLQAPKEFSENVDVNTEVKAGVSVDIDEITPKKRAPGSAKAAEKGISDSTPVAVTAKTPLKVTNSRSSVLKQSLIESFCHPDRALQETSTTAVNMETTVDSKDEAISVVKASIKSTKRPRKASDDNAEGSDVDSHVAKGTPSNSRKQAKSEQGAGTTKVSTLKKGKNSSSSKVQGRGKGTKDEKSKQQKISKVGKSAAGVSAANSSTPQGRKGVSRSHKSSTDNFGTEDEDSDTDDENDDSDEDYFG
ncbi:hypothetical protein GOP47_0005301 [Adiantum capillus-veneris]|uniref:DNA-binding protein RHL1 n=1 Tax=Adiantum capillus-veneris TaxID=13818 RepID=A0A9D4ZN41_ADICA|nr:hypothetical protein GOP47_0005301 [Adiantum capillus-veneris]